MLLVFIHTLRYCLNILPPHINLVIKNRGLKPCRRRLTEKVKRFQGRRGQGTQGHKYRKKGRGSKRRWLETGFSGPSYTPQPWALLCWNFLNFTEFRGWSVNSREPGWTSSINASLQGAPPGRSPQAISHCRQGGSNRKLFRQPWGPGSTMPRTLASPEARWHRGGRASGCQMCTHTYVCHC